MHLNINGRESSTGARKMCLNTIIVWWYAVRIAALHFIHNRS